MISVVVTVLYLPITNFYDEEPMTIPCDIVQDLLMIKIEVKPQNDRDSQRKIS